MVQGLLKAYRFDIVLMSKKIRINGFWIFAGNKKDFLSQG